MTFALGKGFGRVAAGHLGLTASLNYTISGEFDVHLFVMDNNQIRVKILAAKATTKGVSAGISLMGFNALGGLIVEKLMLQPKAPFIGAVGQFETKGQDWADANNENLDRLEYDPIDVKALFLKSTYVDLVTDRNTIKKDNPYDKSIRHYARGGAVFGHVAHLDL